MFIIPDWPAPVTVKSAISRRLPGFSQAPYDAFNLADHVGDDPEAVSANRQQLVESLGLPMQPKWLQQVHGTQVIYGPEITHSTCGDASYTDQCGEACVVLTADCLPLLLCNQKGTRVAAVHAGWRGLCSGIVRNTLVHFSANDTILAYLGPAIGPQVFEVGTEVLDAFVSGAIDRQHRDLIERAFKPSENNRYLADLYRLATIELKLSGVNLIFGGSNCTYSEPHLFFSYRRDHSTGRNASLIWLDNA